MKLQFYPEIHQSIESSLERNQIVLIYGLSGAGKTGFAKTISCSNSQKISFDASKYESARSITGPRSEFAQYVGSPTTWLIDEIGPRVHF